MVACKPGIPKDIVQPAEMEKILYDIHVLDGYVANIPTPDSAKKVSAPLYKGVFKKYGIDSAMHAKSMAYYYQHADLLTKMYNSISEKINKTRDEETKRQEKEQRLRTEKLERQDSLQRVTAQKKITDSLKKVAKDRKADSLKKPAKPLKRLLKAPKSVI